MSSFVAANRRTLSWTVLAGTALALGGCGLIKVPLPPQNFSLKRQDAPTPAVVRAGGLVTIETPGSPLNLKGLPSVGGGELTGGSMDFALTFTPLAGATLAGGSHGALMQGVSLRVAFYETSSTAPVCGDAGFETLAEGFSQAASVDQNGNALGLHSSLTFTPAQTTAATRVLQEAISKNREGGWSLKACLSATLLLDGAPAPAGAQLALESADGRLNLNGVL